MSAQNLREQVRPEHRGWASTRKGVCLALSSDDRFKASRYSVAQPAACIMLSRKAWVPGMKSQLGTDWALPSRRLGSNSDQHPSYNRWYL
eukprot:6183869-Pleurochrysis_carterae.AAC.3